MRRFLLGLLAGLTVFMLLAGVWSEWRNAEDATLDDTARAEAPGRFVTLTDGITHYELVGPDSGRTVVLVHGFSVPYYIWDSTSVALSSAGYRVLRYDLFGRGFSDRPRTDYDSEFYDRQLRGLLDSLKITGPVDLAGLSFGGFVASNFATTHTDRVRTLTLVDPMSEASEPGPLMLPVIGPWLWRSVFVPGMAEGQTADFLHPENHPTWVDRYRPQMRYEGFGRALLATLKTTSDVDFDSLYAGVAASGVPVLLIWGRQDRTIPFEVSEIARRNIPSLDFVPVDSAGHLPHIEQSALVHARLISFLEAHASERDPVTQQTGNWIPLFNGLDLSDWIVKIAGHEAGDNHANTFRVEDGVLKAAYDGYSSFDMRFGHLFYHEPFSDYHLVVEYRFTGDWLSDAPGWARRNSGVMLHAQDPRTMPAAQDFPISVEMQFLGGLGDGRPRPTGNMCSPGTEVSMNGETVAGHCVDSSSPTYHGDQWVRAEAIVRGDSIAHIINGDTVLRYTSPRVGGGVVNGYDPAHKVDGTPLTSGFIALQAEGHPIEFRKVELRRLTDGER